MTTKKEIIANVKAKLIDHFRIVKADIKVLHDDSCLIHLPFPDKEKPFPYRVGRYGNNVFVPFSYGPDGVDLRIELPAFELEYGPVSDCTAASLAIRGLLATHKEALSGVRACIDREYVTDDFIRSSIRLFITPKRYKEFEIAPWFHSPYNVRNSIVVSIDPDVVFDVYRELEANGDEESVDKEENVKGKLTVKDVCEKCDGKFIEFDLCFGDPLSYLSIDPFERNDPVFFYVMDYWDDYKKAGIDITELVVEEYQLLTEEEYYDRYVREEYYDHGEYCPESRILLIWITPESYRFVKFRMMSAENASN